MVTTESLLVVRIIMVECLEELEMTISVPAVIHFTTHGVVREMMKFGGQVSAV